MSSVRACLDKVKYAELMARLKIIFLCHSQDLDAFVFRGLRLLGFPLLLRRNPLLSCRKTGKIPTRYSTALPCAEISPLLHWHFTRMRSNHQHDTRATRRG